MKQILVLLLATSLTIPGFAQSSGKEGEVWVRVEALNKAIFEAKDSAAINELVADGVTYGHSTGLVEDKPTMIRNAVANEEVYSNLTSERLVTVDAGKAIVVRYILRASTIKAGSPSSLNISIMQVWAKDKGKWRLFARQAVKVNPK
ncbi:MAG: hypothetical protein JWQ40_2214 [Segetibacter sp.]|nr:hypothetical protein [Segetibacter sp.]